MKVEYHKDRQEESCSNLLAQVLRVLDNEDTRRALDNLAGGGRFGYPEVRNAAEEVFLDEIVRFKHEAFEVEQEWRLAVRPRDYYKQGRDDGGSTPPPTYFRRSKGVLIPYVKLLPLSGKLPITSIRSGPTLDSSRAGFSLRTLLGANGFPEVRIEGSGIPVRR
jgi:hypothetical protein